MDATPDFGTALVVCEGNEDRGFLEWLIARAGLINVAVRAAGSKDASVDELSVLALDPTIPPPVRRVAAIFDADDALDARRRSVIDRLRRAAPDLPLDSYMFPDDASAGELEDLCLAACRDMTRVECARAYAECLLQEGYRDFKKSKLTVSAYVVANRRDSRSISQAARREEFDFDHPDVQKLVAFLRNL